MCIAENYRQDFLNCNPRGKMHYFAYYLICSVFKWIHVTSTVLKQRMNSSALRLNIVKYSFEVITKSFSHARLLLIIKGEATPTGSGELSAFVLVWQPRNSVNLFVSLKMMMQITHSIYRAQKFTFYHFRQNASGCLLSVVDSLWNFGENGKKWRMIVNVSSVVFQVKCWEIQKVTDFLTSHKSHKDFDPPLYIYLIFNKGSFHKFTYYLFYNLEIWIEIAISSMTLLRYFLR